MIREMVPSDGPAVAAVFASSVGASHWSAAELLLLTQGGARVWIADEGGEIVGASAARTVVDEVEILNLGVCPSWRRKGLGRSLMAIALGQAVESGAKQVFLEVRESNHGAQTFYATLGFAQTGRRPHYYREPVEDALVLSRSLTEAAI